MTTKHSATNATATDKKRSAWRPLAMATIGGAVLVTMGAGVWATLSATAANVDPQNVSDGTLKLTMAANGTGFTQAVTDLAPGDVVNRYVDLTNGGTLDGQALTLTVTGTGATALTTDATRGLHVSVTECTGGTWTAATAACSGTKTVLLTDKPVSNLGAAASLVSGTVASGTHRTLQVSLKLPDSTETTVNGVLPANTVQGLSTNLTYTFAETQRSATTKNS